MKFKKRILGLLLSLLAVVNMYTVPAMAAEQEENSSVTLESAAGSIPTGSTYKGTIYRRGGTVSLGRVTLVGDNKIHITFPRNSNLDLFQGTVTFRDGVTVVTKNLTNMSLETWSYGASDIGSGIWTVSVSGYAIGTTQKCEVWSMVGK